MEKVSCSSCGYSWEKGQDGSHSCSIYLQAELTKTKNALKEIRSICNNNRQHPQFKIGEISKVLANVVE